MPTTNLTAALTHRMNYLVSRQGVVAGNIANASTPNYLARDIQFQKAVDRQVGLRKTNGRHLKPKGQVVGGAHIETMDKNIKNNGNSVVVASEMLKLNEIQLNYSLMTQLYSKHAGMQRSALGQRQ